MEHTKLEVAKTQIELANPFLDRAFAVIKMGSEAEKKVFMNELLEIAKKIEGMVTILEVKK